MGAGLSSSLGVHCVAKSTDMTKVRPAGKISKCCANWAIPTNGSLVRWTCREISGASLSPVAAKEPNRTRRAVPGGPKGSECDWGYGPAGAIQEAASQASTLAANRATSGAHPLRISAAAARPDGGAGKCPRSPQRQRHSPLLRRGGCATCARGLQHRGTPTWRVCEADLGERGKMGRSRATPVAGRLLHTIEGSGFFYSRHEHRTEFSPAL